VGAVSFKKTSELAIREHQTRTSHGRIMTLLSFGVVPRADMRMRGASRLDKHNRASRDDRRLVLRNGVRTSDDHLDLGRGPK
ncbi:MAG: hypothetical protein KDC38_10475, partial [Planctomycetes bacterium]|nr:hypothetical protein [Planctomycetota bacterium]